MNFAQAARNDSVFTRTENGAVALNTTGDARLDLFGTIGSLRGAETVRIERLFSEAYKADPLFAAKIAFYARDVRGGLGERQTFRTGNPRPGHDQPLAVLLPRHAYQYAHVLYLVFGVESYCLSNQVTVQAASQSGIWRGRIRNWELGIGN